MKQTGVGGHLLIMVYAIFSLFRPQAVRSIAHSKVKSVA